MCSKSCSIITLILENRFNGIIVKSCSIITLILENRFNGIIVKAKEIADYLHIRCAEQLTCVLKLLLHTDGD